MTTFAKPLFSATSYASFRPTWPSHTFERILAYHSGPRSLAVDLGCGHGMLTRQLAPYFESVIGVDPSIAMIKQARVSIPSRSDQNQNADQTRNADQNPNGEQNISFHLGTSSDLSLLSDTSVDLIISSQAAHWFDFSRTWPEISRVLRKGSTVAFLGGAENVLVGRPAATRVLWEACYARELDVGGKEGMGKYWEQPGRDILTDRYRGIVPPESEFEDVKRWVYEPRVEGGDVGRGGKTRDGSFKEEKREKGERAMVKTLTLGELEGYIRTFSAYYGWLEAHPGRKPWAEGGTGDIVDEIFERILEVEPDWENQGHRWRDVTVHSEWGSVMLLARRK